VYIVLLRMTPHRDRAAAVSSRHKAWIEQGIADGVFLLAGTLEPKLGGVLLADGLSRDDLDARIALDPFVQVGAVEPEVLTVTPSMAHERLRTLSG
jgi:uncharacterized protein YciI